MQLQPTTLKIGMKPCQQQKIPSIVVIEPKYLMVGLPLNQ